MSKNRREANDQINFLANLLFGNELPWNHQPIASLKDFWVDLTDLIFRKEEDFETIAASMMMKNSAVAEDVLSPG